MKRPLSHEESKLSKPTALGVYIFAGGFTLGVRRHFDVLAHFEGDNYGVATARKNFPDLPVHIGPENWPIRDYHGIDFIYGNPPCAAWSVAGYTKTRGTDKWRTDPRVECTVRHFGLLAALRPKVWVWESVVQAYTKGAEFVRKLEADALAQGYAVTYLLHNAYWLGLPQVRKRFFMICHKIELPIVAPNWSPGPGPLEVLQEVPKRFRNNGGHCEPRFPAKVLRRIPPGTRLSHWWESENPESTWKRNPDGGVIGRPSYGHYRLHPTEPSGAVVGYNLVHPVEHRFLSIKEYQALSGFPLDYEFTPGGYSARASEIARGLCPPVAEWLARNVAAALRNERKAAATVREINYRQPPAEGQSLIQSLDPARAHTHLLQLNGKIVAAIVKPPPAPARSAKSGAYIRVLLKMERWTTAEIVAAVRKYYRTSKATQADVAWHRDELKKAGQPVRPVRIYKDGSRKLMERGERK